MERGRGIRLESVTKRYGQEPVVRDVSLEVRPGEFLSLLGPSGCGKTTTLRIIAGFVAPTSGRVFVGDREITDVPAHKRGISLVFQNYALWPHMTVWENIAFGLKLRRFDHAQITKKVDEVLAVTNLRGLENRFPRELSGGQQQRVAVSRALALDPPVLLMDEPLSNLDRKLRVEMRKELKLLQERLGVTTLYVTHDQDEALSMSDRVAIMHEGRVLRTAPPRELYEDPQSEFVASFVGNVNVIDGKILDSESGKTVFATSDGLELLIARDSSRLPNAPARLVIRPERIVISCAGGGQANTVRGTVVFAEYFGSGVKFQIEIAGGRQLTVQSQGSDVDAFRKGDIVSVTIDPRHISFLQ